jgi:hypothetical protein
LFILFVACRQTISEVARRTKKVERSSSKVHWLFYAQSGLAFKNSKFFTQREEKNFQWFSEQQLFLLQDPSIALKEMKYVYFVIGADY